MSEVVSLREYVERVFAEKDKALSAALAAEKEARGAALASAKEAVDKAERGSEQWRASANEWRAAMTDREQKFITRDSFEAMAEKVNGLERRGERREGTGSGVSLAWAALLGMAGLAAALVAILK